MSIHQHSVFDFGFPGYIFECVRKVMLVSSVPLRTRSLEPAEGGREIYITLEE